MAKPLSYQKLHAILRGAGFTKAEWHPSSRVRGWGRWSTGYSLEKMEHGFFRVRHISERATSEERQDAQARYAQALAEAGLYVKAHVNEHGAAWVLVKAQEE